MVKGGAYGRQKRVEEEGPWRRRCHRCHRRQARHPTYTALPHPPPASIFVAAAATVAAIRLAQRGDVLAPRSLCRALCVLPATPGGSAGRLPSFVRSNTW